MLKNTILIKNLVNQYLKSSFKIVNNLNQNMHMFTKNSYHTTSNLYEKKKGQFVVIDKNNETNNETKTNEKGKPKKVKLYPGFQISSEEMQRQLLDENKKDDQNVYAKKVIEDFYGLNELEYEKDENDINLKEDDDLDDGNFDIEKVIKILNAENVQSICCIEIPKEINYADYMVIGNCLSDKHLNSVFFTVNKKYKLFKNHSETYLSKKSGQESKWCAIDTGKIVIHLFLPDYRDYYDLESLWTCGSEYDEKYIEFKEHRAELEKKLTILEIDESKN